MIDNGDTISTMRLFGSAIALVSGGYSLYLSLDAPAMTLSIWVMIILGLIVILHGIILLTVYAADIESVSGPLMIGYAILMLLLQWWMEMDNPGMMMEEAMAADPGMIALAILMLFSGLVMARRTQGMA